MTYKHNKKLITRRTLLKGTIFTTLGTGIAGASTIYYAYEIEPAWFDITLHQIHLPHLTPAFQGYRLLHISDIHADDTFMNAERLRGLVQTINNLQADMVVITGDFVTEYLPAARSILLELNKLQARDGVFGVLGNHDHPAGLDWIRESLHAAKVQELPNQTHTIRRGDQMLHIIGMDDLWPANVGPPEPVWTHQPLLEQLTTQLPGKGAAILLVHEPDFADVAAHNSRIDLQLSGHSHGGQVRIPFYGPIILPPLSRHYPQGLYKTNNLIHYTNNGLGMLPPQIRFDCRPEIALFELLST
jgi:hypothetical protein